MALTDALLSTVLAQALVSEVAPVRAAAFATISAVPPALLVALPRVRSSLPPCASLREVSSAAAARTT